MSDITALNAEHDITEKIPKIEELISHFLSYWFRREQPHDGFFPIDETYNILQEKKLKIRDINLSEFNKILTTYTPLIQRFQVDLLENKMRAYQGHGKNLIQMHVAPILNEEYFANIELFHCTDIIAIVKIIKEKEGLNSDSRMSIHTIESTKFKPSAKNFSKDHLIIINPKQLFQLKKEYEKTQNPVDSWISDITFTMGTPTNVLIT